MDWNCKMMKVMTIFGTRPEAIKMCPLIKTLKRTKDVRCIVCLTGQHKEMLDSVMETFHVVADYNLQIMKSHQTLSEITCRVLSGLDKILEKEVPDVVLVHGDTTTSFAAALACFYKGIPVGHVEAGLRTYDMNAPFPEEFNRQAVDLVSKIYFAPTRLAKQNLISEGKSKEQIFVTGNTVIDALQTTIEDNYRCSDLAWCSDSRLLLVTAHRRENLGKPMVNMFKAIRAIVDHYPDVKVIYPVHKNERVREIANEILGNSERIRLIEPLDVIDFHNYMKRAYIILTDSGGVQEEAPAFGIPVLVMRDTTERTEGIEAGTLKLVGTSCESIYRETCKLLDDADAYQRMSIAVNPYGDGHASERITEILLNQVWNKKQG